MKLSASLRTGIWLNLTAFGVFEFRVLWSAPSSYCFARLVAAPVAQKVRVLNGKGYRAFRVWRMRLGLGVASTSVLGGRFSYSQK